MNPYMDIFWRGTAIAAAILVNGFALILIIGAFMAFVGWTKRANEGNQRNSH